MGTASTKKFLRNNSGQVAEEAALLTSAGAGDANRIPALNAAGILDDSIVNSKSTSAGAGDAGKIPKLNASGILNDSIINSVSTSAGASSAGKRVELNASGQIDETMLPTGVAPDLAVIVASEALSAGNLVNIWSNAGVANMRKADAASNKPAHGFVKASIASLSSGTCYFEGRISGLTTVTPGENYLGAAGAVTATPPTATGSCLQRIGLGVSTTEVNFEPDTAILLA